MVDIDLAVAPASAVSLGADLVPTAGTWTRDGAVSRFTPRFAVSAGTVFVVLQRLGAGDWLELATVRPVDDDVRPSTHVLAIQPDTDGVPANLLRIAVAFSSEMEEGTAAGGVRLLDESGAELPGTLLGMPPELWDRGHRRLTVLLEPGRIKRGLMPNRLAEAPLRDGRQVTVVVGATFRDARGARLVEEARRTYRVGPPVRARVDPRDWSVTWPDAPGGVLTVCFDRPMDHALVGRCLRVRDDRGRRLVGEQVLDPGAERWSFAASTGMPEALHIDTRLEDLAGNSVRRVFDRDLSRATDDRLDTAEVVLRRP